MHPSSPIAFVGAFLIAIGALVAVMSSLFAQLAHIAVP